VRGRLLAQASLTAGAHHLEAVGTLLVRRDPDRLDLGAAPRTAQGVPRGILGHLHRRATVAAGSARRGASSLDAVRRAAILYDADCGFCKWATAKVLAWDRDHRLRPVALQDPEAGALLEGMDKEQMLDSWHLVSPEGEVYSAGNGLPPLLRLLPGGRWPAAAAAALPRLTELLYRLVSARRAALSRWLRRVGGPAVVERAERRISERAGRQPPPAPPRRI
jgi:predicted DCC family thiol-disulfide oxidoreductase YuxK